MDIKRIDVFLHICMSRIGALGMSSIVVSYNWGQFKSHEFKAYYKCNYVAPYITIIVKWSCVYYDMWQSHVS